MTTASVKERKEIFEELRQCIKGRGEIFISVKLQISVSSIHCNQRDLNLPQMSASELPEPAIRGLCKLFCLTPHRYRWVCGCIHNTLNAFIHSCILTTEAGRVTDTQGAHFIMKIQCPCREVCVCSSGMPHHAECSSLLLASWLRLSLKS